MASTPAMAAVFSPHPSPLPALVWVPCGWCGGQRRYYEKHGDGLVGPIACERCLGIGEVPPRG